MKVRDLAKELGATPAELIEKLADIAPNSSAAAVLNTEQVDQARALYAAQPQQPEGPEEIPFDGLVDAAKGLLIEDARGAAYEAQIMSLVDLYLSSEPKLPDHPELGPLVKALGDRAKKHPSRRDGALKALVNQVIVVDGEVLTPELPALNVTLLPVSPQPASEVLPREAVPLAIGAADS